MNRLLPLAVLSLLALPLAAHAQNVESVFANEGLRPDGYIDFADLPPAPVFPVSGTSAPFTATLPVHGVPSLTVQVTVAPFTFGSSGAPIYTAGPGSISFNGGGGYLQLHFSTGVQGLSVESLTTGRAFSFSLQAGADLLNTPFATGVGGEVQSEDSSPLSFQYPLQLVQISSVFQDAYIPVPLDDAESTPKFSNLRVQSAGAAANAEALVATDGLQMWLRSEDINGDFIWPDHSGHGHDSLDPTYASQAPGIAANGIAGQPSYVFAGGTYRRFNLPINGWTEMTVFLVASCNANTNNYASENAAIFWTEDAQWGNTFVSPYQTHAAFRFGTTQVGNQPIYTRPNDIGQDFTITRAVHNQTTDTLYVDGVPVLTQTGKYASLNGTTGAGTIGLGLNNTPFNGAISEILVYNRVLTEKESTSVEKYLRTKFRTP